MKNDLINVTIKTMVGQLPKIITQNNEYIREEFDHIYDSSHDTLILPHINTNYYQTNDSHGLIESWSGVFRNLTTEYIDVSAMQSKENIVKGVSHDKLSNRYLITVGGVVKPGDSSMPAGMEKYAHNAGAIGVTMATTPFSVKPLSEIINNLIQDVSTLKQYVNNGNVNINSNTPANIYGLAKGTSLQEPDSFTFDNNILFSSKTQLRRMNLPAYQYSDISDGFLYTYYNYANVLTISDEHTASISGAPGFFVTVRFNDMKKKAYYRIVLSRKEKKFLRVSKDELIRLQLVCVANSNEFGSEWDVNTYSVRNTEDLVIERK